AIRNKKTGEIIASKSNYLGCNVFRINKARDKILRIVKKQGTINKIVGIKDFSREANNRKEAESKLKHVSTSELLREIKNRADNKLVGRKDLLELAGIDWCLEC
ncbi:30689_t:CDS:2, partial [Racocetra persica]